MNKPQEGKYGDVDASPVKSFFVSMLTRDIQLEEAILDLLDNCVDGILRSKGKNGLRPYEGYKAEIEFSADSFLIHDNCGGIPWELHTYAFRMGSDPNRPREESGTVGVYGIGMKRAIFKMGKRCLISTRNKNDQYEVEITPDWIEDEGTWTIPVREANMKNDYDGTTIMVGDLHTVISETFGERAKSFTSDLNQMIAAHYAYIIDKGFEVSVNGVPVKPRNTKIVFDSEETESEDAIRPFVFRSTDDGISVYLAVGFTRPIPSEDELRGEQESTKYSSVDAGWTILCNDRAVLFCDRSELTGWGEAGVPRYHTQFIAISGIVEFKSEDPSKLPTTTTKRGIDASSPLYLQVKNKMREGMKIFTNYTNKWKGRAEESKRQIERGVPLSLEQLKSESLKLTFSETRRLPFGEQYKPKLPAPRKSDRKTRRISFVKEITKIDAVASYFGNSDLQPSEVGEGCFDVIHAEASE